MKHCVYPTTAALVAVVFLLVLNGCTASDGDVWLAADTHKRNVSEANQQEETSGKARKKRRKASDYSRIPVNAPADWQQSTMGI